MAQTYNVSSLFEGLLDREMLPECVVLWAEAHGLVEPTIDLEVVKRYIE